MVFEYKNKLVECNGFNMSCFFNSSKNEYIATIRETMFQTCYPEAINKTKKSFKQPMKSIRIK